MGERACPHNNCRRVPEQVTDDLVSLWHVASCALSTLPSAWHRRGLQKCLATATPLFVVSRWLHSWKTCASLIPRLPLCHRKPRRCRGRSRQRECRRLSARAVPVPVPSRGSAADTTEMRDACPLRPQNDVTSQWPPAARQVGGRARPSARQ